MANKAKVKKGKGILLENVPVDIQEVLISKNVEDSEDCKCTRGQDYSLYKIVREWNSTIGREDGPPLIVVGGNVQPLEDFNVSFEGSRVVITARFPITTPVGLTLNIARIERK